MIVKQPTNTDRYKKFSDIIGVTVTNESQAATVAMTISSRSKVKEDGWRSIYLPSLESTVDRLLRTGMVIHPYEYASFDVTDPYLARDAKSAIRRMDTRLKGRFHARLRHAGIELDVESVPIDNDAISKYLRDWTIRNSLKAVSYDLRKRMELGEDVYAVSRGRRFGERESIAAIFFSKIYAVIPKTEVKFGYDYAKWLAQ